MYNYIIYTRNQYYYELQLEINKNHTLHEYSIFFYLQLNKNIFIQTMEYITI